MKNFFDNDTAKAVYYVYLYGGVSKAGEKLHLSQSAMSRKIQIAEERAGIQIFDRDYHRFTPTKEGLRYIDACKQILHIGDAALKDAHAIAHKNEGTLSVLTTPSAASLWLPKMLTGYFNKNPKINLHIMEDKNPRNILESDAVIYYYQPETPHLSQHLLYEQQQGMFASKEYIDMFGVPNDINDLDNHRLLALDEGSYDENDHINWHLKTGLPAPNMQRRPFMTYSSNDGRYTGMCEGHGIGVCGIHRPKLFTPNNLVRVLPEVTSEKAGIYFAYNAMITNNTLVTTLLTHLQEKIAAMPEIYQST